MNINDIEEYAENLAKNARKASRALRTLSAESRNAALNLVAAKLRQQKAEILAANKIDLEASAGKISDSMMDRLTLNDAASKPWPRAPKKSRPSPTRWARSWKPAN